MSFLSELKNQKKRLKETNTIVKNAAGEKFVERGDLMKKICSDEFGFVVDTKPDNIPVLVVDNLFIGSQDCAVQNVLEQFNIKHVLSIGINVEISGVEHKFVECLDLPDTNITSVVLDALPFICNAIEKKENVLLHCNAGVSRTSMVAIAYLMQYKNLSYDEAYDLIKKRRPAIQPNAGFIKQLKQYNPMMMSATIN